MQIEIVSSRYGYKQVLQLISERLKTLQVWKVRFQNGDEVMLFKCGNEWMQRIDDNLEKWLLEAIGEKIDQFNPAPSF